MLSDGDLEAPAISGNYLQVNSVAPIDSWTVTAGSVDQIRGYWRPYEGQQSIDLTGVAPGTISQTVSVQAGKSYAVAFAYAANPVFGPTIKQFHVTVNGSTLGSFSFDKTGKSQTSMGWVRGEVDFVPSGSSVTVAFVSDTTGNAGAALDAISIVQVPAGGPVVPRELPGLGNSCFPCSSNESGVVSRGDPIDTSSGSFIESFTDLAMASRGPQVSWTRAYSSLMAADDGPLGFGWHASYTAHLNIDSASGDVRVSQENGAEVTFTNNVGTLSAPPRAQATLVKNGDGSYTFERAVRDTLSFDPAGKLLSITDRNGLNTTLGYTGGHLATVTDPAGRVLTVTSTGSRITRVSNPIGESAQYGYDPAGNLTTVTAPDGGVTTFGYDVSHHLARMLDPEQQALPVASQKPLLMVYDTQSRVQTQTDQMGRVTTFAYAGDPATGAGGTTVTTDPSGNKQQDTYQFGLRTVTVRGSGSSLATTTSYTYDPVTVGVTSTSVVAPGDPNNHLTTAVYNAKGLPTTQTDGVGRQLLIAYNGFNQPLTVTSPNPSTVGPATVVTSYAYDPAGNLATITKQLWTTATTKTDQVWIYLHSDPAHPGDVTGVTDPTGKTTFITRDPTTGLMTASASPQGRTTTYTYDAVGRLATRVEPKGNSAGAVASRFTTTYGYDPSGRPTSISVPNGPSSPIATGTSYDKNGRPRSTTDPLGHQGPGVVVMCPVGDDSLVRFGRC